MEGLLNFIKSPAGQGLLAAVAGGMANARGRSPINNIGRGLVYGLQGYSGAIDQQSKAAQMAAQQEMQELQKQQIQAQLAAQQRAQQEAEAMKAKQAEFLTMNNPAELARQQPYASDAGPAIPPVDPYQQQIHQAAQMGLLPLSEYIKTLAPKEQEAFTLSPGQERYVGNKKIAGLAEKQDPNKPFLGIDPATGQPIPNPAYQSYELEKASRGAARTSVNVNTPFETEQDKVYGKGIGEMRLAIDQGAFQAPRNLANLDRMEQLLDGAGGGKLSPTAAQLASAAKSVGLEIDPKLGDKEAAEALAVEMALAMRQPGSGPMTDKDFENFLKTTPGLAKTPEGRKQITRTLRAKAERDLQIAQLARAHASRNGGRLTNAFQDEMAQFLAENPVWGGGGSSGTGATPTLKYNPATGKVEKVK